IITNGKDYQVLRNLRLLEDNTAQLSRHDEFDKIRSNIHRHMEKTYDQNKRVYDLRTRPRSFQIGQLVIKQNFTLSKKCENFNAKLAPIGDKAIIKKRIGNSLYLLEDLNGRDLGTFHAKDIWE
ncbi:hypothetical protein KR084_007440, partial [Drosophila pseudotakahashii]